MNRDNSAFRRICEELENRTSLSRLESRGTVRLALKRAGLDARDVTAVEMRVVVERILPSELDSRGIFDPQLVGGLAAALSSVDESPTATHLSPAAIFRDLGGDV